MALYEMVNEEFLIECWRDINKEAAYGVDEVSAREYEQRFRENIRDLVGDSGGRATEV